MHFDETVYTVKNSADAARFATTLEQEGITEYRVSGPTIEDVLLKVAEELDLGTQDPQNDGKNVVIIDEQSEYGKERDGNTDDVASQRPRLLTGRRIGLMR